MDVIAHILTPATIERENTHPLICLRNKDALFLDPCE